MEKRERNYRKQVRFSEREMILLKRKMKEVPTENFSLYARKMLLDGKVIYKDFRELKRLIAELNRIGNNINQIAKKANETESVARHDFQLMRTHFKQLLEVISDELEIRIKEDR